MAEELNSCDKNRLQHIVQVASKITGVKLPDQSHILRRRATSKARGILQCPLHTLNGEFELLSSGQRFRAPKARSNRLNNSFISQVSKLLNAHDHPVDD